MSQQCGKWISVFACLAGVASPASLLAQYAKAPDACSVTQVNSMFGPAVTMEISRDGNWVVVDHITPPADASEKAARTRTYYDLQAGKTYSLDPTAPGAMCGAGRFSGDWGDPFAGTADLAKTQTKDVGADTVNGIAARVLEVTIPGQPATAKAWVEGKYGLVLKLEMAGPNGQRQTISEIKKVSFEKPPASAFVLPAACASGTSAPTEEERIAAITGGNGADFSNAIMPPSSPSRNSCTVLLRVVRAGSMAPISSGFQVAVDKAVDLDHPASYQMGSGPGGRMTFSGGGLKEVTGQLKSGVLRIDDVPAHFDIETAFGNAGSGSALIYRQCFAPQTVLLYVIRNPAKLSDGPTDWLWVKSGKYATLPAR
jgi:hypothetical protein